MSRCQYWNSQYWSRKKNLIVLASSLAWTVILTQSEGHARLPTFQEVKSQLLQSESRIYDRRGELIHEFRTEFSKRHLGWIPLSDLSPAFLNAVLLSEDKRFFKHQGVDWIALTGIAAQHLIGYSTRGASTISMQLVGILNQKLKPKRSKREWRQKVDQIYQAIELEKSWSKEQILEAYLNIISFRGELQGIASATRGLFGKVPSGLNQDESLVLAVLIRSPQANPQKILERACSLSKVQDPLANCESLSQLLRNNDLQPRAFPPSIALAPHAARQLIKQNRDHSSLDRKIQTRTFEILRRHVVALRERNMKDGAALIVENKTGQMIAYVGSVGSLSTASEVDGVQATRQAGSTLKPFLYGLAIENKFLTAASKLNDSIENISLGIGSVYRPRDFDHEYHGDDVTLRLALGSSLNIPAVRALQLVGVDHLIARMKALGFRDLGSEEFYGPSLALGTADVTLFDLVNAYRTFANQGRWSELTFAIQPKKNQKFKQVFSPESSFIISDILSDPASRSLTFGMDTPLSLRFWSAAKTGTSKDMRDNWCIGYSARYTVGVWTGNFSGESMWNVSGVSGAAPAWAEIMQSLEHSSNKEHSSTKRRRLERDQVLRPPRGVIQKNGEWYIRGTEPSIHLANADQKPVQNSKITYPVEGLLIARDPDIPMDHQQVGFESSGYDPALKWVLNREELASASKKYRWVPHSAGPYELKLMSASGKVYDQVRFTVR